MLVREPDQLGVERKHPQLAFGVRLVELAEPNRHVVLGHLQRGGTPTANDRILSTRYGLRAAEAVNNGEWGKMVALRGNEIVTVDLSEATEETKTVPRDLYEAAVTFFG